MKFFKGLFSRPAEKVLEKIIQEAEKPGPYQYAGATSLADLATGLSVSKTEEIKIDPNTDQISTGQSISTNQDVSALDIAAQATIQRQLAYLEELENLKRILAQRQLERATQWDKLSKTPVKTPALRIPDAIVPIVGWRVWRVDPQSFRLKALGQDTMWTPKTPLEATCLNDPSSMFFYKPRYYTQYVSAKPSVANPMGFAVPVEDSRHYAGHCAPCFGCQCGIWAFKRREDLLEAIESYSTVHVVGQVHLWGKVIETENGFRAQFAYPAELWLTDPAYEELGRIYNVPVRVLEEK